MSVESAPGVASITPFAQPSAALPEIIRQTGLYPFEGIRLHDGKVDQAVPYDEHLSEIVPVSDTAIPAVGLVGGVRLNIAGELLGDEEGYQQVVFPRHPSNILFIMRHHILEARSELSRQFSHGMMLGHRLDPVDALLQEMFQKPLGRQGHAYTAVVALSELMRQSDGRLVREASYAAGKTAVRKLLLPQSA